MRRFWESYVCSILRVREWLLLRYATVCFALLSVMVSHGERCDGNRRGMLGSCNAGHVKPMHASERGNAWGFKTNRMHVDSERNESETAIEE